MEHRLPKLKPNATIGIFSPSCPITFDAPYAAHMAEQFLIGCGFRVKHGARFGKIDSSYRSGTIKERAQELNELIYDESVDCIMAAAGGYVSDSILPYIDYAYLKDHPKIFVGHSDVTSVLLAVHAKCGFPVFYGPNFVTSFAHSKIYREYALKVFLDVVNSDEPYEIPKSVYYTDEHTDWYAGEAQFKEQIQKEQKQKNHWKKVVPGKARGRLMGGNTDNFSLLYGNPYCPEIQQGDILFLENINEEADFFERAIANLFTFGIFEKISGLIFGKPKGYNDIGSNKSETEIFSEIVNGRDIPILADFDCGHTLPIATLPIGKQVCLDTENLSLTVL